MKIETQRELLLKPLQQVVGVVERRQTLPILANVLVTAQGETLTMLATDMEVELRAEEYLQILEPGEITLPARKLLDILKALPEEAAVNLTIDGDRALLRCGRSRFNLATLPAADYPAQEEIAFQGEMKLSQGSLRTLLERTHFAMAQQDVRYYLNGLMLETADNLLRAVATDGHRLAYAEIAAELAAPLEQQIIVPRKGVQELLRLLVDAEDLAVVRVAGNHIQVELGGLRFTSKLIDGRFPDYQRVIPRDPGQIIVADRLALRSSLTRAAILSSDKYRGVRLQAENHVLQVQAHNPEQEEAQDELEVSYGGTPLEIGFNVNYLLDALGALQSSNVKLAFTDANSSCLLTEEDSQAARYVVMPMRL